ncbi:MAG: lamin tail domain-containing protein [Planctomycetes bacterium]|nr:lamin tail domain-containing protein [Planctomycetota bacterium]
MLAALFSCLLVSALPQGGGMAAAPVGMTVVVVDVGQGDGILLRAPDGTVHCIDAGVSGQGTLTMLPVLDGLLPTGYGFTFVSHHHSDHLGGLDEVLARPFAAAFDRGDVNRPSTSDVTNYLNAAGARRQQITLGGVYALGGGATLTCIAENGNIVGGGFVNPTASSQEENSRSIVLRLDYGQFSMWLGGDLTGGGNSTADVESAASLACGDVDLYKLNHHGSSTSTSTNLVTRLSPELAVVSCGYQNSYGHPNATPVNRLNQALAARALLSTTTGSANTIGFGVAGHIRIDTDGRRYRATAENGDHLDFWCDEVATPALAAGDVRLSELHRDPGVVPDTNGEYVEVVNLGSQPVGLRGLQLATNTSTITIASNYLLVPGRPLVLQTDGAPTRNGGQPLGVPLPYATTSLGNSSDTVVLRQNGLTLDSLNYSAGQPGGAGIASERRDLFGAQNAGNYAAAPNQFGDGDRGSPGALNPSDTSVHPVQAAVTVASDRFTVHGTAIGHPFHFSVLALAYGTAGFPFGGATIPLSFDSLFEASLSAPDFLSLVPPGGYRSVDVALPVPNPLAGLTLYASHIVLDWSLTVPGVSPAISFVLP